MFTSTRGVQRLLLTWYGTERLLCRIARQTSGLVATSPCCHYNPLEPQHRTSSSSRLRDGCRPSSNRLDSNTSDLTLVPQNHLRLYHATQNTLSFPHHHVGALSVPRVRTRGERKKIYLVNREGSGVIYLCVKKGGRGGAVHQILVSRSRSLSGARPRQARRKLVQAALCLLSELTTSVPGLTTGALSE